MIATIFSSLALLLSFGTMIVLYRNRLETNRPVVTVLLEGDAGNTSTPLTIKVYNTGNTPALDVELKADSAEIDKVIADNAPEVYKKDIYACFSKTEYDSCIA